MIEINKFYNDDCLNVMQTLPDKSIDLVLTDPPYGININKMNYVTSGAIKIGGAYRRDYSKQDTEWDKISSEEIFTEIFRVSKNQIIWGGNYFTDFLKPRKSWIVWDKRTEDKYNNDFADGELAWTSMDKNLKIFRFLYSGMLQGDMKNKDKRFHPTQKPVKLFEWCLENYSNEDDLILDCFSGSGTTAIACHNLNRRFICIEKDFDYYTKSVKRYNKHILQQRINFKERA